MIPYFPAPYPDELFYSVLCRLHAHCGNLIYRATAEQVFAHPLERPDILYMNGLRQEIVEILSRDISIRELAVGHTMFPCYARFMPAERRERAMASMLAGDRRYSMLLRTSLDYLQTLRFCPVCVREDREEEGETYWHRMHQLPGIRVCPVHGCMLQPTELSVDCRMAPGFWPAETVIPEVDNGYAEVGEEIGKTEIALADYMYRVMVEPLPAETGETALFLHAKLHGTPYCSVRGKQRNMARLREDMKSFYQSPLEDFSECPAGETTSGAKAPWRLDKIFSGQRWPFEEICAIGLFLGIPPGELSEHRNPEASAEEEFDREIARLRSLGLSYPAIAKKMHASINLIKPIGEGRKILYRHADPRKKRNGPPCRDWEEEDQQQIGRVKQAVAEIESGTDGRPGKVSVTTVERLLDYPCGYLSHLPQCLGYVRNKVVSQEEHWAKEIAWASEKVVESGEPWQWTSIRRRTNMRRRDLEACLPWLRQYMSEENVKKVRELL